MLTKDTLTHILNSINRIQTCDIINDDINIYDNYNCEEYEKWINLH